MIQIIGMAAGVVILTAFLCMLLVHLIGWIGDAGEEKKAKVAPVQPEKSPLSFGKRGYVCFNFETNTTYVMDAEDMDRARIIIRYDDRGIWKTENGQHGPWILVAEVDHG